MKSSQIFMFLLLLSFLIIKNQSTDETDIPTEFEPSDTSPLDTSGNGTEPVTDTIPDTVPPGTEAPLIILLGFSTFIATTYTPKKPSYTVYTFVIYFYRMRGNGTLNTRLSFTITITYIDTFLRQLQSVDKNVPVDCVADPSKKNGDEDMLPFLCNFESNKTLNTVKSNDDYNFGNQTVTYEISSQANETSNHINLQTSTRFPSYFTLNETTFKVFGQNFSFNGFMKKQLNNTDKVVYLAFDEGKGAGILKNVTCGIVPQAEKNYRLDCYSEDPIDAALEGVSGNIDDPYKVLLILMKDGQPQRIVTGANYQSLYKRDSSSGLSGGAIAAIVIAFVIALIALAIIVMMCKKTANVPAPFQESTLGINTNSINQ